jgi:hypothetical protein
MGIPSLEVQHGIIYLGPRSGTLQSAVEYMATYGPQTNEEFAQVGYTDETTFSVGSPRFDVYPHMRERSAGPRPADKPFTIACVVPAILPQSWSDSYEVVEYLTDLAEAARQIPNVLVILKLRPDPDNEAFYRDAITKVFAGVPHRIAQYELLVDIFEEADVIVSIYSTTVLEGLISGRPTIYTGILEQHRALGETLASYNEAGALLMVNTREELTAGLVSLASDPPLREGLVRAADAFMAERYSFDGHASEKLADAIRTLANKGATSPGPSVL